MIQYVVHINRNKSSNTVCPDQLVTAPLPRYELERKMVFYVHQPDIIFTIYYIQSDHKYTMKGAVARVILDNY